jgi:hypothetical protein
VKRVTSGAFSFSRGVGNGLAASGLAMTGGMPVWTGETKEKTREKAMGQQLQYWRSGGGEKLWLSMLIDTMERLSRPTLRNSPCDPSVLIAVQAHLARPAAPYPRCASPFSLRN